MLKLATRLIFAATLAIVAISLAATSATASRSLSLNPAGAILMNSLGRISFNTTLIGTPISMSCNMTLHGSLSRVIPKVAGTLIGKITSMLIPTCDPVLGQPTTWQALFPQPWKIRYQGISGTLPNPSSVQLLIEKWSIQLNIVGFGTCLYEGNIPINLNLRGSAPNTNGLITFRRHNLPLRRVDSGSCGANGELLGSFGLTPTQTVILLN